MKYLSLVLIAFVVLSCKNKTKEKVLSADEIVNKSINVSGGDKFENSDISFEFRDVIYTAVRMNGNFSLTRMFNMGEDVVIDTHSNDRFIRSINFEETKVADSMAIKYMASVNSVHYFSVLPYGLNDKAVNKTLLGETQIKDKTYYKIKITFNQEGGGEDYEDVFVYWIDKESFKIDYLAYSYNEDDGVGMRFREAYNERYVNGIRFVDYNNYKSDNNTISLEKLGEVFENNQLKLLSKIELENVAVELIDN
jgi:hypothetical protein